MDITADIWMKRLKPYMKSNNPRAFFELFLTVTLYITAISISYYFVNKGNYFGLLGIIPGAFLIVRLFIIQHDCGHEALFSTKPLNDWVGRALGVFTVTPYDHWKHQHALHHAGSGNLEKRRVGDDIHTLTLAEYQALSPFQQFKYRLFRHPITLFVVGPFYLFFLSNRLPITRFNKPKAWLSVMSNNAGILLYIGLLVFFAGWQFVLLLTLPIIYAGAAIGVWLFYIQHQYEDVHWSRSPKWNRKHAALHGSSYYDLPKPIMWLTGYIGVHHVHHLSSRIAFFELPKILKEFPELKQIGRMNFIESLKCARLALYDEAKGRMMSFKDLKAFS